MLKRDLLLRQQSGLHGWEDLLGGLLRLPDRDLRLRQRRLRAVLC